MQGKQNSLVPVAKVIADLDGRSAHHRNSKRLLWPPGLNPNRLKLSMRHLQKHRVTKADLTASTPLRGEMNELRGEMKAMAAELRGRSAPPWMLLAQLAKLFANQGRLGMRLASWDQPVPVRFPRGGLKQVLFEHEISHAAKTRRRVGSHC